MFTIIAIIIVGALIGTQLQNPKTPKITAKLLYIIVHLLLLVMGILVGGNERIVNNLSTIGLKAFIIAIGSTLGSIICAAIIYKYIFKKGKQQ